MMEEQKGKILLDDDVLDAVLGGVSIYEGANGMDRDSWFVRLVRRRMPNGGLGVTPPPGAEPQTNEIPFTTLVAGDYSSRP